MSIYASLPSIGLDDDEKPTGDVLGYRGSHVFPEPDDARAAVFLSSIPGHCVPGQDDDDFTRVGGFLRLDVMQNVDTVIDATVVLTVAGATLLRDQLTEWLGLPKRERTDRRDPTMTTDLEQAARALPDGLYAAVAIALTAHNSQEHSGGNGYTEPREAWVTCSCGASVWEWQQFYNERDDDPEERFEEHLTWAISQAVASWLSEYLLSDENVERAARASFELPTGDGDYTWAEMVRDDPQRADIWREDARKVLSAVLGKDAS